jgi:hypothetical protein
LASKCSVLLCINLLSGIAAAEAFGRFGYDQVAIPGFALDKEGFRVRHPSADRFRFFRPLPQWKALPGGSAIEHSRFLGGIVRNPNKFKMDLLSPGFQLYFPDGFELRLTNLAAPLLSWSAGSFEGDTGFPTPPVKWAVLSFRDSQPPVLFSFPGNPAAMKLTGKAGAWVLRNEGAFAGWIRIAAPTGTRARRTNTAAELGALTNEIKAEEKFWTSPSPKIVKQTIQDDERAIEVMYEFDRAHVIVPPAASMAKLGGNPLSIRAPVRRINAPTEEGLLEVTNERFLGFRFQARRVPTGRAITLGPPPPPFGTASYLDYAATTELALANCVASADLPLRKLADQTFAEYLGAAETFPEPVSGQNLPYASDGTGLDLAAAHALLMQSTISTRRASSDENSLLTSVAWRRDWASWQLMTANRDVGRRAAALAAIAATMTPEPSRRLEGAFLEAGLDAERGLAIWKTRVGVKDVPTAFVEPMESLRFELYDMPDYRRPPAFGTVMLSELRAYGEVPITLTEAAGKYQLVVPGEANSPVNLVLASTSQLEITPPEGFQFQAAFGFTILRGRSATAGPWSFGVGMPAWAPKPPVLGELPRYQEVRR